MNKPFELKDPEDREYCERMLFIDNGNRKLWEKGQDKSFLLTHSKINIGKLMAQLVEGTFEFNYVSDNSANKLVVVDKYKALEDTDEDIAMLDNDVGDSVDNSSSHHVPTDQDLLNRLFNN